LVFKLVVRIKNYLNKYIKKYFFEIVKTVGPIILLVLILHFSIVRLPPELLLRFLLGIFMVVIGLNVFLKGIRLSLLPVGEMIGSELPKKKSVPLILLVSFIIGFSITVAEPDVRVLAAQIDLVSNGQINKSALIVFIGIGIGLFLLLAFIRILKNIPLIYFLLGGYFLVFILSFFTPPKFIPISFDAGGVTTGPVTVPAILSLGIGMVSVLGGKNKLSDAFGLIGIASIGPVITVMVLGMIFG